MPITITMPALSPTMEEGNLAKWLVKEGDQIAAGDVIAEIETDKATMEVEAVDEGTVAKILIEEGTEGVKVNAPIAILAEEGEDVGEAARAGPSDGASASSEAAAQDDSPPKGETAEATSGGNGAAKPQPETPPRSVSKSGADIPDDVKAGPVPRKNGERVFASPLARRIAGNEGIDITAITGSGPKGRIVKRDVEAALEKGVPAAAEAPAAEAPGMAAAPAPIAAGPSSQQVLANFAEGSYELVKHDGMRKTIAKRLTESKQTIPHFYVTVDCDLDALLALRSQLNKAAPVKDDKPAYKLSVNDMIIKALALALRDVPDANVSWTDEAMVHHKHADVGVAVSIPGGLITPIVRRAEEKTLSAISGEMKDLGKRARERKLKPEEYQGGTTSVSNMGMMRVKDFSAVINPPHATILAVGAGEQRPVVRDGALAIATMMSVTLSTDHRCVDGALGAELLAAFKGYIENPMGMLV
ncbi:pyruvate dehydrogenase complex dihydrolipoamide acetyltransferase [Roseitalea porphyridii]|uniref:Acetyltransferase component of pyruvate dehydrogenase complex n=1 Tax=Roseitalea porphyridii TaxID=1852022 RepID=A0A4P6V1X6_9HYPH|nr:pyruvate dehydrogenase complex dihydrolipoamide acetyltransferase [Roseitalea porphyridii]QBK30694.1 pyruvate dehydrogenase complex dihydrolipoamide acetyltransferase [Roseitalea porphyridii]